MFIGVRVVEQVMRFVDRKSLIASVAVFTGAVLSSANPASAADMYHSGASLKDRFVHADPVIWKGFYLGINGGYGFSGDSGDIAYFENKGLPFGGQVNTSAGFELEGGFIGGQIGYNFQMPGRFVVGIEADLQKSYLDDDFDRSNTGAPLFFDELRGHSELDYFGTVRARLGYAFDRTLLYATGGFAFGEVESEAISFALNGQPSGRYRFDKTLTGYSVGGGVEHAIGKNWSIKADYLYTDLEDEKMTGAIQGVALSTSELENDFHTVRVGLNYRLGSHISALK